MKKLLLFVSFVLVVVSSSFAQRVITGNITDTSTDAIIGANVLVKGTNQGTITDINGDFNLTVPDDADGLIISYTGFQTQEVDLSANTNFYDIVLTEGQLLDEIVISGQGSGIAKKRLSTTVDFLNEEQLDNLPANQIDQILQSTSPSAQIRLSSGQPGTAAVIRTRGPISASSSSTPIVIVDGIRVDNLNSNPQLGLDTGGADISALADIPTESIEKIEYIKGGAATTLYGADAANGVIQIITKKGRAGQGGFFVETRLGSISGTEDYLKYDRTAEALFETGISQEVRVGMSGGGESFTYNFGGSIYADDSFNDINEQSKKTFNLGFSADVNDRLKYQGSASYVNFISNLDWNANTSFSRFSAFEGGGRGNLDEMSEEDWQAELARSQEIGQLVDIGAKNNRITLANKLSYDIADNVFANLTLGVDLRNTTQQENDKNSVLIALGAIAEGTTDQATLERVIRENSVLSSDLNFTHDASVKHFDFTTIIGGRFFRTNDVQNAIDGSGGVDGTVSIETFPTLTAEDFVLENANYGLYFLENFGIYDVAYIELGGTIDWNTSAGDDTKGLFAPKIGVVYNISDHDFYRDSPISKTLSGLKVRANYGESLNFAQPFSQDRTFELENFLDQPAFRFANPGNADLISERIESTEFGAELGFFDYRLNFSATRYDVTTVDALFTPTQPPSSGLIPQIQNIGEIKNSGWELSLNGTIIQNRDHNLRMSVSYNTNNNFVESTGGAPAFNVGGFTVIGSWVEEGQSLGYLRGTAAESNGDGTYTFTPNTALGSTFAPKFGSMSLSYSWRDLTFFTSADYQWGGKIVDLSFLLRHLRGVDDTGIPEDLVGTTSPFNYVNYFTYDNDFFKIRNIGVSYNIREPFKAMKGIKVGLNLTNPLNWTSGLFDPETTGSGVGNQNGFSSGGFYYGTESAPRRVIGSLRFQF